MLGYLPQGAHKTFTDDLYKIYDKDYEKDMLDRKRLKWVNIKTDHKFKHIP